MESIVSISPLLLTAACTFLAQMPVVTAQAPGLEPRSQTQLHLIVHLSRSLHGMLMQSEFRHVMLPFKCRCAGSAYLLCLIDSTGLIVSVELSFSSRFMSPVVCERGQSETNAQIWS